MNSITGRSKPMGENMLPPHIFNKKKDVTNVDKIKDVFPEFDKKSNNDDNFDIPIDVKETEEYKQLKSEYDELENKFNDKIGTKKELVEKVDLLEKENKSLKAENESLKSDIEDLLNSEGDKDDSP